jgi:DNA polymerase-3 subunit epsilon
MQGFAVIDLETTGFAYNANDRVCEIGVVLVDADGRREASWTTLINPKETSAPNTFTASTRPMRAWPPRSPRWWAT